MPKGLHEPGAARRSEPADGASDPPGFFRRVLFSVAVVTGVVLLLALLWAAGNVLLLVFAGILLAALLTGMSEWLQRLTGLSHGWALAAVCIALLAVTAATLSFLTPSIASQIDELRESLPKSVERLRERADDYRWSRELLAQAPSGEDLLPERRDVLSGVTGVFSNTLGAVANIAIVLFLGLYLSVDPALYREGLVRLVPPARRDRARVVLLTVGYTLRWWLVGKLIDMAVVGVLTWLGLVLLGVPLALTLALLAALLTFIPNIGPVLAAVPAVLLALLEGPTQALYVVLLYLAVQTVESYLITPIVQQRTVSLPPALTITAQVLLGVLAGALGLLLATPLAAMALVLVKMLYVEDALEDRTIEVKGEREAVRAAADG